MDTISDMIISIKHGGLASKESVIIPHSKLKFAIASALLKAGFVKDVSKKSKKTKNFLEIGIAYDAEGKPRVHDIKRVSKPSRRIYSGAQELRSVRQGYGIKLLSTPKGILSDREAKKENVGGEVLLMVW